MNRLKSVFRIYLLLLVVPIFSLPLISTSPVYADDEQVKIGVLAKRGAQNCLRKWSSTAEYLSQNIPNYSFSIVPLNFDQVIPAVEKGGIDFVLTNPAYYVSLEINHKVDRLVTLINKDVYDKPMTTFAGVIFTKTNRQDITSTKDLVGKRFVGVDPKSFGGWLTVLRELKQAGINSQKDFTSLLFAGTHDAAAYMVLDDKADVGCVRTSTLERMAEEDKINLADFKVIHDQSSLNYRLSAHHLLHSTRAYPEWPLAKLNHVDDTLAIQVAKALIDMPSDSHAAQSSHSFGWSTPLNYLPVHECLRELRLDPYRDYGQFSIADASRQYWPYLLGTAITILLFSLLSIRLRNLNRNLEKAVVKKDLELTLRQEVEKNLRQSDKRFQDLFNSITDLIYTHDFNGRFLSVNPAMGKIFGYKQEDFIGRKASDFMKPEFRSMYETEYLKQLNSEGHSQGVTCYRAKNGRAIYIEYHTTLVKSDEGEPYFSGMGRDVTERTLSERQVKKLQEQVYQSQKMEAIGTLAGGVAHDFNNILTVINGHAQLGMMATTTENPLWDNLANIDKAAERAGNLTRQLLAFSRKQAIKTELIQIKYLTNDLIIMLKRLIGEDIILKLEIGEKLSPILADPGQLEQVIINLVVNAADAIKDQSLSSGRNITISISEVPLDDDFVSFHEGMKPGWHLLIEIADNGCGISKEVLAHIFEPFYTTKEVGKGTGLGLATVYGIVKQNDGTIQVESEPGQGATFKIYWPSAKVDKTNVVKTEILEPAPGGSEVILLTEDEEETRKIATRVLELAGYTVIEAENGLDALEKAKDFQDSIDLLFTDIVMPVMGGKELSEKLTATHPRTKVLFTSGYLGDRVNRNDKMFKDGRFLNKPYDVPVLLRKIRQLLDNHEV